MLPQKLKERSMKDKIVESVIQKFEERSLKGIKKYGTTLEDNECGFEDWLTHAQEESMDFVLYLEKLKQVIRQRRLTLLEGIMAADKKEGLYGE